LLFSLSSLSFLSFSAGGYGASVEAYEQSLSQYIATNPPGEEKFKTVYKLAQFFKGMLAL
jgi:hypothetical protein